MNSPSLRPGTVVELADEDDCIIPAGIHIVSRVNDDGSFHCGGNTAVWPRRIVRVLRSGPTGAGRDPSTGSGRDPSTGSGRDPSTRSGRDPSASSGRCLVNGPARHVRIGRDWADLGAKAAILVLWLVSAALVASQ